MTGAGLAIQIVLASLVYAVVRAWWPSPRRPAAFLRGERPTGRIVVCAGASATQGNISWDWVSDLARRLGPDGYTFVNAGIGGFTATAVRRTLASRVLACDPTDVVVMVGVNDVNAGVSPESYRAEMARIVAELRAHGVPRIALLTLTAIGDHPDDPRQKRAHAFHEAVRELAAETGVRCLDLARVQERWLSTRIAHGQSPSRLRRLGMPLVLLAMWERYVLQLDYDTLSRLHGLLLTTDGIHQNSIGGGQIREIVEAWLREGEPPVA